MTSQIARTLTLGEYIAALVETLGDTYPAALLRLHLTVGDCRARIFLDDEAVEVAFGVDGLGVYSATEKSEISGEGATDTATVLDLLDGHLEVTDAILSGRLRASGSVGDITRMFSAIEIILDSSSRTPALQALALRFQREEARQRTSPVAKAVHVWSYPFPSGLDELKLLGRLDLMPDVFSSPVRSKME